MASSHYAEQGVGEVKRWRVRYSNPMQKLLTVKDLSELLQMSPRTIYEWVYMGYIPHYKFSKGLRFKEHEIESWLKKMKRKGRITRKIEIETFI
jgi:excisionase family DNA binding protein